MKQIVAIIILLIAGLLGSVALSSHSLKRLGDVLNDLTEQDAPSIRASLEMEVAIKVQGDELRSYLGTHDENHVVELNKAGVNFEKARLKYVSLSPDSEEVTALENLKTFHADYAIAVAEVIARAKAGKLEEATKFCDEALDPVEDKIMAVTQRLLAKNDEVIKSEGETADELIAYNRKVALISVVLVVVLATAGGFSIRRLSAISRGTDRIANALSASAGEVKAASTEVSSSSQMLADGSSTQAASLEETSASLEEISSMTARNVEGAHKAKELASQSRAAADLGAHDIEDMVKAMNAIKASSDDISKIIKTIDVIAFQTNILALNAAVEAARAGEAGAGFAVVADEVRSLAQRAAASARESTTKIQDSAEKTKRGVDLSDKLAVTLKQIVEKIRSVDDLVGEIEQSSSEQAQGIEQVNTAVSHMDKVTQNNASIAEESAASAEELRNQSEELHTSVKELRTLLGAKTNESSKSVKRAGTKKGPAKTQKIVASDEQPTETEDAVAELEG